MKTIREYCNERQKAVLDLIQRVIQLFYEEHDNAVTYALTGLISELTQHPFTDVRYIREKVDIILKCLEGGE